MAPTPATISSHVCRRAIPRGTARIAAPVRWLAVALVSAATAAPVPARAQAATRLAVLQAEDRRAPTAQDLATIRAGARSADPQTARIGVRALGRLERPALVTDILPALVHRVPEVRAEAANAVAQAARGATPEKPVALAGPLTSLVNRLGVEAEPSVRAALAESIGRLPYRDAAEVARAEGALVGFAPRALGNTDRLGLAKGLEALARLHRTVKPPDPATLDLLKHLARNEHTDADALRDARVRRLALEALTLLGAVDPPLAVSAGSDPDAQTRRLGVRAAATLDGAEAAITRGLSDPAPMVRIEALRALRTRPAEQACATWLAATTDPETGVSLIAIDQLATCGAHAESLAYLTGAVADLPDAELPRNWHRTAHALVALAQAAPDAALAPLTRIAPARTWQLRLYAARAAATLKQRALLETLAHDPHHNVVEAAVLALSQLVGHEADAHYVAALKGAEFNAVRAAALALAQSPSPATVVPALREALDRVERDTRPGAIDARAAIRAALTSLGDAPKPVKPLPQPPAPLTAADLRRLAAPRARIIMKDVGTFDVALFTMEAPATVLRFVQLAEAGYYNGLTFHRLVPNGIIQGGGPGANEYSSEVPLMRDEVGLWPHVRGAVGISTRGRDTGDGQIFIDLVDNPRYDHTYTVFAQVLNGIDVLDRLLEGDVIEHIDILP
jgi:cyclophilin family peptidyl-prolyl cis-trans isomerase